MISLIEAIILSIVQGITEWFPISSSGHLALFQNIFGFQNLPYDVFLHFASIIAVIVVFWKEVLRLLRFDGEAWNYIGKLIIAIFPIIIIGFLFRDFISSSFSNLLFLGVFFLFSGILIYLTKFSREVEDKDKEDKKTEDKKKPTWFDGFIIGLFQAIAVFPGISRSGMTISGGLFSGLKKKEAIRFSFLLAIPIMILVSIVEMRNFITQINYSILIVSFIITFFTSLFTIKILLKIVNKGSFWKFGIYNLLLGLLILMISLI